MTYDPDAAKSRRPLVPAFTDVEQRVELLGALDLDARPYQEFDLLARDLARMTGAPYTMVNLFRRTSQYFIGLYARETDDLTLKAAGPAASAAVPGREMSFDHGYCPYVVDRRKALVLDHVSDYPRYAGNPVVDELNIYAYIGAPLIHPNGTVLGTVCAVDTDEHHWGQEGLKTIKGTAGRAMELILRRERDQETVGRQDFLEPRG